jgi:hypothetical protein
MTRSLDPALLPALDLSMPPNVAASALVEDLGAAIGEPATGDDIRHVIGQLTAIRGELAREAGERDLAAARQMWTATESAEEGPGT